MILQTKPNEKKEIEGYKPRLVAHSFRRRPGINFDKTSAPLVSLPVVRLVLTVFGRSTRMSIKHLNVTMTFLESKVNEELYIILSKGMIFLNGRLKIVSGSQVNATLLKSQYSLKRERKLPLVN